MATWFDCDASQAERRPEGLYLHHGGAGRGGGGGGG